MPPPAAVLASPSVLDLVAPITGRRVARSAMGPLAQALGTECEGTEGTRPAPAVAGDTAPQALCLQRRDLILAAATAGLMALVAGIAGPGRSTPAPVRLLQPRRLPPPPAAPPVPAQVPAATVALRPLPILARSTWTRRLPAANHRPLGRVQGIVVHHTGVDYRGYGLDDASALGRIESWHRDELGWACIGYHILIGADGRLWEGRPLAMQGAHARGANEGTIGVACLGALDRSPPGTRQLAALQRVLEGLCADHRLPRRHVAAHLELAPTACPGPAVTDWLASWRGLA